MINYSCSDIFPSNSRSSRDDRPSHLFMESAEEPSDPGKVGSRHMPKQRRVSSYLFINHTAASCEPIRDLAPSSPCFSSVSEDVYDDHEEMNLSSPLLTNYQLPPQRAFEQCFPTRVISSPISDTVSSTHSSPYRLSWLRSRYTPKPLTTFYLFPYLPLELQHIILSFTAQTGSKNDHVLKHTLLPLIIQRHRVMCHSLRPYPTMYSVFLYSMHRFCPTRMALMHTSFDAGVAMMGTWKDIVESLGAYLAKSEPEKVQAWVGSLKVRDGWDEEQAKQRLLVELAKVGKDMGDTGKVVPRTMEEEEEGRGFRERSELGRDGWFKSVSYDY